MYIVNALAKLVLLFLAFGKRTNHILTVICNKLIKTATTHTWHNHYPYTKYIVNG
jgi:hypothetical protein